MDLGTASAMRWSILFHSKEKSWKEIFDFLLLEIQGPNLEYERKYNNGNLGFNIKNFWILMLNQLYQEINLKQYRV